MDLPDRLGSVRAAGVLAGASLNVFVSEDRVRVELSRLHPPGHGGQSSWKTVLERWSFPRSGTEDPYVIVPTVLSWVTDQLDLHGWPDMAP